MSEGAPPLLSMARERALRAAAQWHRDQFRRGNPDLPYFVHVVAVATILDRLGFDDEVVIAGLLHDAVEDGPVALETIAESFGPRVAELVDWCTERKVHPDGSARAWSVRKTEYLERLTQAPAEARAVALADKLHNLLSIEHDVSRGVDLWALFHAEKAEVLRNYDAALDRLGAGDDRLVRLAAECRRRLESIRGGPDGSGPPSKFRG